MKDSRDGSVHHSVISLVIASVRMPDGVRRKMGDVLASGEVPDLPKEDWIRLGKLWQQAEKHGAWLPTTKNEEF